ncbi:hypothetical protein ABZX53_46760, partial [Streptomyces sp. NPDC004546]
MGELMGKLRDLDQMVAGRSVQALTSENITLKRRFQQLTIEHRTLRERLEGARWNLRFADKRIADPKAQILEQEQASQASPGSPRMPRPSGRGGIGLLRGRAGIAGSPSGRSGVHPARR